MGLLKCPVLMAEGFQGPVIRDGTRTDCLVMGSRGERRQTSIQHKSLPWMPREIPAAKAVGRRREYSQTSCQRAFNVSETPTLQERG